MSLYFTTQKTKDKNTENTPKQCGEEAQKETIRLILTKILCSSPTSPSSCQRFGPLLLIFILLAKRAKTARNASHSRDEAEARWKDEERESRDSWSADSPIEAQ